MIRQQDVEDWKLLLEGAPITVSVKYQPDAVLERTPFFITTNEPVEKWIGEGHKMAIKERII